PFYPASWSPSKIEAEEDRALPGRITRTSHARRNVPWPTHGRYFLYRRSLPVAVLQDGCHPQRSGPWPLFPSLGFSFGCGSGRRRCLLNQSHGSARCPREGLLPSALTAELLTLTFQGNQVISRSRAASAFSAPILARYHESGDRSHF